MAGQRRRHARAPRRSRRARGRRGRLELDRRRGGERALMERDESRAVRRGVREAERLRGERRGRITVEVRPPLARGEQMAQVPLLVCAEAPELREHLGRHAKPPGERPAPPRRLHAAQPRGSKTSRGRCDPAPARLARLRERGCRGATGSSSSAAAPRRRRGTRAPPPPPQGVMRAPTRPAGSVLAATAAPPPAPRLPDSRWLRVRGSRRASTRGESTARAWRRTVSGARRRGGAGRGARRRGGAAARARVGEGRGTRREGSRLRHLLRRERPGARRLGRVPARPAAAAARRHAGRGVAPRAEDAHVLLEIARLAAPRGVSDQYGVRDAACPLSTRGRGGGGTRLAAPRTDDDADLLARHEPRARLGNAPHAPRVEVPHAGHHILQAPPLRRALPLTLHDPLLAQRYELAPRGGDRREQLAVREPALEHARRRDARRLWPLHNVVGDRARRNVGDDDRGDTVLLGGGEGVALELDRRAEVHAAATHDVPALVRLVRDGGTRRVQLVREGGGGGGWVMYRSGVRSPLQKSTALGSRWTIRPAPPPRSAEISLLVSPLKHGCSCRRRRVRSVRGEGRGVSGQYGVRDAACPVSTG